MENWKRYLVEQQSPVTQSVNRDKIKAQFSNFIKKYRIQIPEIESIVEKYIDMKMKEGSADYSDLADFVAINRKKAQTQPADSVPTDNPSEFDPTDHRNWR